MYAAPGSKVTYPSLAVLKSSHITDRPTPRSSAHARHPHLHFILTPRLSVNLTQNASKKDFNQSICSDSI
jgi:hypothetical protein